MYRDVTPLLAIDDEFDRPATVDQATEAVRRGAMAIVASPDDAVAALVALGSSKRHAAWLVAQSGADTDASTLPSIQFGAHPVDPADTVRRRPRQFRIAEQFHLKGTQYDHDQSTHGGGGGGSGSAAKPKRKAPTAAARKAVESMGAGIRPPSREELEKYDPVPGTAHNEQTLLAHLDADGNVTPERKAVHDDVLAEVLTDPKTGELFPSQPEGERKALVMGGGAASGKTTALNLGYVTKPENATTVNPDDMKILLPEARGPSSQGKEGNGLADEFRTEWASILHEESSVISKRHVEGAIEAGMNIVVDKVNGKGSKAVKEIQRLQAEGYQVEVQFVTTDVDRAVAAAIARGEERGRFVPESITRHGHEGANRAYLEVAAQTNVPATLVTTYGDRDGQRVAPVLTAQSDGQGRLFVRNQQAWEEYLTRTDGVPEGLQVVYEDPDRNR